MNAGTGCPAGGARRLFFSRFLAILESVGAVAQLGERFVRNEEVVGSIPISSTPFASTRGANHHSRLDSQVSLSRSSPVQRKAAQPRQVRKEATVGKSFCVTQGSLTSFLF